MAALTYKTLREEYNNFHSPIVEIEVGGNKLSEDKKEIGISDVVVDLTAGFEASQATYTLYNVYDRAATEFDFAKVKKYVMLGYVVKIYAGYDRSAKEIFRGVITRVNFIVEKDDMPGIQVTAMDVKAVMMANNYSKQLKAGSYSEAVKEIFQTSVYQTLQSEGAVSEYTVDATPDASTVSGATGGTAAGGVSLPSTGGASLPGVGGGSGTESGGQVTDKTIEMVGESDYEFIVKVAKKFNYDFFVVGGQVLFRKAKSDTSTLIEIDGTALIQSLNVEYDVTGLVGEVEVRGLDAGKAKLLKSTKKNSNKISQGSKAKSLINGSKFVYIDPTVSAKEDADYRAEYLLENISYRFGTMELTIIGLPDIKPGRFMELKDLGTAVSNTFYIYGVRHTFSDQGLYTTKITGRAAKMDNGGTSVGGVSIPSI